MKPDICKLEREGGRWTLYARRGAESATEAAWLCLGGCGDVRVAVRLWLSLIAGDERK